MDNLGCFVKFKMLLSSGKKKCLTFGLFHIGSIFRGMNSKLLFAFVNSLIGL